MQQNKTSYSGPLALVTTLFFCWGFLTVLNDVLIPHFKSLFELSNTESMLVNSAFFGAYFLGSVAYYLISKSSGDPINKIGYKNAIILGLLTSALGSGLFFPASFFNAFWPYLLALFVLGLGFTILQIAANPYVAILGNPETASSRLNMAQGFNSLGTTIAPLIGGYLIFQHFEGTDAVRYPYLIFSATLVLMAILMRTATLPPFTSDAAAKDVNALQFPQLKWGIGAIFMYVGAEVAIGSIMIDYFGLEEIMGMEKETAKHFVSLYWGGAMIGRFLGAISQGQLKSLMAKTGMMVLIAIALFALLFGIQYFSGNFTLTSFLPWLIFIGINIVGFTAGKSLPGRILGLFAAINVGLLLTTVFTEGSTAFWSLVGIGLFNSIMWSNIFTLAIDGLKEHTGQGSSLLVMAILGGAIIPPLQGFLADAFATPTNSDAGIQISFLLPVVCYIYIAWYGWKGSKMRKA